MTGTLKRVLVRPPLLEDVERWREYGWKRSLTTRPPQPSTRICVLLEEAGAEVVVSAHDPGNPDAIYVYDPVLVGDAGAVLLRPGKEGRRGEPEAMVRARSSGDTDGR